MNTDSKKEVTELKKPNPYPYLVDSNGFQYYPIIHTGNKETANNQLRKRKEYKSIVVFNKINKEESKKENQFNDKESKVIEENKNIFSQQIHSTKSFTRTKFKMVKCQRIENYLNDLNDLHEKVNQLKIRKNMTMNKNKNKKKLSILVRILINSIEKQ